MRPDDKRRTCECGHRYRDHAKGGTACLASDSDRPGGFCSCQGWAPPLSPVEPTDKGESE